MERTDIIQQIKETSERINQTYLRTKQNIATANETLNRIQRQYKMNGETTHDMYKTSTNRNPEL